MAHSFINSYIHAVGVSEIPIQYHQWCALSTIAACVGDRVWIEKFKGKKLLPNLYLILLGPSGIGKGGAMNFAEGLVEEIPIVNHYCGMITGPKLIDWLGKPQKIDNKRRLLLNSKIFLLTPELSVSVGNGIMADKFVKLLTALYEGHTTWNEGTRTSGDVIIKNCCINWCAGSTKEWLVESLPKSSIDSGFLARSVVVQAGYNYDIRIPLPEMPEDFNETYRHLKYRCMELAGISGEFELTREARQAHDHWYMTRPQEHDIALEAAWHRDDDLVYKLAMLLSLADDLDLVITQHHIVSAQRLVARAHRYLPSLLTLASQTPETEIIEQIRAIMKKHESITHRSLLMRMSAKGKKARDVHEAMRTLSQTDEVEFKTGPKGGMIYYRKK